MDICSKYPFLDSCRKFIPKEGFTEQYIHYAYSHLWDQAPNINFESMDVECFLLSLILLKNTDNTRIYKRWIELFCKKFESLFLRDVYADETVRNEVLPLFGIQDKDIKFYPSYCTMKIPYYLLFVTDLTVVLNNEFKLVNQNVSKGRVNMYYQRFVLILREKLKDIIYNRLKNKYTDNPLINEYVEKLKQQYPVQIYKTKINNNGFPPCIVHCIEKAEKEHHLTHNERILISTYMFSKGYDIDWLIENVFKKLSDWNERITRYQLNYIKEHKVMNCDKVEIQGMCRKNQDQTGICNRISNPYHF